MHRNVLLLFVLIIFNLIFIVECRFQEGIFKYEDPMKLLGTDLPNPFGDENPAIRAKITGGALAYNQENGDIFIADSKYYVVRKIDAKGIIHRYAGGYKSGFSGDGGLASDALISTPTCLVFFSNSLYICDSNNHVIRKVDSDGVISTVVGKPGNCSTMANDTLLCTPSGLTFSPDGLTMFIADNGNRIKQFTNGTASIIAGQFKSAGYKSNVPGNMAIFDFPAPSPILYDSLAGGLYLGDRARLQFINLTNNFVSDVTVSKFPSVAILSDTEYIYMIYPNLITKLKRNTNIETTFIGPGISGYTGTNSSMVQLSVINSAVMTEGTILFVDLGKLKSFNMNNSTINTIGGCCASQFAISNAYGNSTSGSGTQMFVDAEENIYLPDSSSFVFRKINKSTGTISELAGTFGISSNNPQGGVIASQMVFYSPSAIMVNDTSIFLGDKTNVFLLDTNTNLVTLFSSKKYSNIVNIFYDSKFDSIIVYDNNYNVERIYKNGTSETIYTPPSSSNIYFVKETNSLFIIAQSTVQKINLSNMKKDTYGGKIDSYISEIDVNSIIVPAVTCIYATRRDVVYFCTSFGIVKLENNLKISTILPKVTGNSLYVNDNEDLQLLSSTSVLAQTQTLIQFYKKKNECFEGFYGPYCNITLCNGIFSNDSKSCSGFGYCSSSGVCNCDFYYYGEKCQRKYIPCDLDVKSEKFDTSYCNGRGLCRPGINCICLSNDFTNIGPTKSVMLAFTLKQLTGVIMTSEDGSCSLIQETHRFVYKCGDIVTWSLNNETVEGITRYYSGYYFHFVEANNQPRTENAFLDNLNNKYINTKYYFLAGNDGSIRKIDNFGSLVYFSNNSIPGKVDTIYGGSDCSDSDCYGYHRGEPFVCSGHGKCLGYNNCECFDGYYGDDCSIQKCFNIPETNSSVCSDNGQCLDVNTCECNPGYFGEMCEIQSCFGIWSNSSLVCSGNGDCIKIDQCECKKGFIGNECENTVMNISGTNSSNTSSSNSNSTNTNNGTFQNMDIVNSTYCDNYSNCSGHGECSNSSIADRCTCYSDRLNGFWTGQFCGQCQLGFYGKKCLTQIIGPALLLSNFMGVRFNLNGPSTNHLQGKVDCSLLIEQSQKSLFGTNPICQWVNQSSSEFTIMFSSDYSYSILPGTTLLMNRLVFDNMSHTDYEEIEVILSDNPISPVVILNGKKNIGFCESLTLDASKSYSLDRQPLKYLWTLISSPNNSINNLFAFNSTSILELDSEMLKNSGEYKIGLQVQSTLSTVKSELNVWTFTKASIPLPILSIIGEKEYHIQKSELPIVVKKTVDIPSCFYTNTGMNIEWKQISGPNSQNVMDSNHDIAIINVNGNNSSDSIYEYQVSSTSVVNPLSTSSEIVKISISSSPLTLQLYLDSISSETALISIEYNDPDQNLESEQWNWSCQNDACGSIIDNYLQTSANQKLSSLEINSKDLKTSPAELVLTLTIMKGSRSISKSITVPFTTNSIAPPIISLISVTPKSSVISSDQIVNLQLQVTTTSSDSSSTDINKYITREWTLNSQPLSSFKSLLSLMTINPSLTNSIVIETSELTAGIDYQLSLKVTDNRNSLNSVYTHTFSIALPLTPCPCTITPTSGIAFQTLFTINCQTCSSSLGNIIQTVYGFMDEKSGASIPLYSQGGKFTTKLPSSSLLNTITVYIKFTDPQTNAFAYTTYDIQINLPVVKSVVEIKKLVSSWTTIQNSLKEGDPAKMVFNSATISKATNSMLAQINSKRVLNVCKNGIFNQAEQKCECQSGFTKIDCSLTIEDLTVYQEIRMNLIDGLVQSYESRNPYETLSDSYLTLQMLAIDSLTSHYDELNSSLFNKSLNLFIQLVTNFKSKLPIRVGILISNIIDNMYLYMKYSDMDTALIYDLSKSFSLLETSGMFVGQKDDQRITNYGKFSSNKIFRLDFSFKSISILSNSIKLPSNMPLFINQKSDRKSISYIFISSIDLFGIGKSLGKSEIISVSENVNNTLLISTNITSTKYIRSDILNFELLDTKILEITNEIEYTIKCSDILNYTQNTLISSNANSSLNDSIITNIYKSSEFSCISFNRTNMKDNSCNLTKLSFDGIATCKCKSNSNIMIIENIIEKVETLSHTPNEMPNTNNNSIKGDPNSLAIILGTILGFSFCLFIIVTIMIGIKLFSSTNILKDKQGEETVDENINTDNNNNDIEMKSIPTISV